MLIKNNRNSAVKTKLNNVIREHFLKQICWVV